MENEVGILFSKIFKRLLHVDYTLVSYFSQGSNAASSLFRSRIRGEEHKIFQARVARASGEKLPASAQLVSMPLARLTRASNILSSSPRILEQKRD